MRSLYNRPRQYHGTSHCHTIHVSQSISVFLNRNDRIQQGKRILASKLRRRVDNARVVIVVGFLFPFSLLLAAVAGCYFFSGDRFSSAVLLRLHFSLPPHTRRSHTHLTWPFLLLRLYPLVWREVLLLLLLSLPNRIRRKSSDVHSARKIDVIPPRIENSVVASIKRSLWLAFSSWILPASKRSDECLSLDLTRFHDKRRLDPFGKLWANFIDINRWWFLETLIAHRHFRSRRHI